MSAVLLVTNAQRPQHLQEGVHGLPLAQLLAPAEKQHLVVIGRAHESLARGARASDLEDHVGGVGRPEVWEMRAMTTRDISEGGGLLSKWPSAASSGTTVESCAL